MIHDSRISRTALSAAVATLTTALTAAALTFPDAAVGWTEASWDTTAYTNTAYWTDGVVNGVFSTNLNSKFTKNIPLPAGYVLDTGLRIDTGSKYEGTMSLVSEGNGTSTLYLPADVVFRTKSGKSAFAFGTLDDATNLTLDFCGAERTFLLDGTGGSLRLYGDIVNGSLKTEGTLALSLRNPGVNPFALRAEGTASGQGIIVLEGSSRPVAVPRLSSLTLDSVSLRITGSSSDTVEKVPAAFAFVTSHPFQSQITLEPNAAANLTVELGSFSVPDSNAVTISGDNLGLAPAAGTANLILADGALPPLVPATGSGTALPIVPGVYGGTSYEAMGSTFVTYDAAAGFRPLDPTAEFASNIVSGAVSADNVRIAASTTITLDAPTTINSLRFGGANAVVNGTGPLTIASGMVFYPAVDNCYISVPVDFGARRGYIALPYGKRCFITQGFAGSNGITFCTSIANETRSTFLVSASTTPSTFTGDVYVNANVQFQDANFFPHGDRPGDTFVYATANLAGDTVINGLYGSGNINRTWSSGGMVYVGDNDSDGDYAGSFVASNLSLTKIGKGTLRLSGTAHTMPTFVVSEGTVILDGALITETAAATVATNAALRGCGSIAGTLTLEDAATLSATPADGDAVFSVGGDLVVNGTPNLDVVWTDDGTASMVEVTGVVDAGTADATLVVNFPSRSEGRHLVMRAAGGFTADFIPGVNSGRLTLSADGTELYCDHTVSTVITLH